MPYNHSALIESIIEEVANVFVNKHQNHSGRQSTMLFGNISNMINNHALTLLFSFDMKFLPIKKKKEDFSTFTISVLANEQVNS